MVRLDIMVAKNVSRFLNDPVLKHSQARTIGYLTGLHGEAPDAAFHANQSQYDEGWLLGDAARASGEKAPKYLGAHADGDLPVVRGQVVTIKKGTLVRSSKTNTWKPAGKTYKVTIHHILNWSNFYCEGSGFRQTVRPITPPMIVWPGTGGYWCDVNVNDIPEAQ